MSQIVTGIIYYLSDINKLYTKGICRKGHRVYFCSLSQKSKRRRKKEMLRSERKTFFGQSLEYTAQLSMEIEHMVEEEKKKTRREACHHIVAQFVRAYPPHAVGFCALSVAGPGLVSLGLKTSSSFASAGWVKSGTENKPPPVLVAVFSVDCSLV